MRGKLQIPPGHASGRVRVIVTLPLAPLAQQAQRSLAVFGPNRKLSVETGKKPSYSGRQLLKSPQRTVRLLAWAPATAETGIARSKVARRPLLTTASASR